TAAVSLHPGAADGRRGGADRPVGRCAVPVRCGGAARVGGGPLAARGPAAGRPRDVGGRDDLLVGRGDGRVVPMERAGGIRRRGNGGAGGGIWKCGVRGAECGVDGASSEEACYLIRRSRFNSALRTPHSAPVIRPPPSRPTDAV